MLEHQALDRVHQLGQKNEVISVRYIVKGNDSVEEVCLLSYSLRPACKRRATY